MLEVEGADEFKKLAEKIGNITQTELMVKMLEVWKKDHHPLYVTNLTTHTPLQGERKR